jgi:quercetin 2,3-dioxygenase
MLTLIKKSEQYHASLFGWKMIANKPVTGWVSLHLGPYASLFYMSHSMTLDECEFPLHPHEGFEIMTFILAGENSHYDTAIGKWLVLSAWDFQILQSNSWMSHREKLSPWVRAFQIWFDPGFHDAVKLTPSYNDHHASEFGYQTLQGIPTLVYVWWESHVQAQTPSLSIRMLMIDAWKEYLYAFDAHTASLLYIVEWELSLDGEICEKDDVVRTDHAHIMIRWITQTKIFLIQMSKNPPYIPIWDQ